MAVSRVGGTKGLLTGSVGSQTYYVINEGNGVYRQVVQAKKTPTPTKRTLRLATQQMCTAIVEAMMRDLKPLIKFSFQAAKTKAQSTNMFSQQNLMLIAQACRQHWFDNGDFYFPQKGESACIAGPFMLSSGSLPYNSFDGIGTEIDYNRTCNSGDWLPLSPYYKGAFIWFKAKRQYSTVGEFMKDHGLTYTTTFGVAYFWEKSVEETEKITTGYRYAIIGFNPSVPATAPYNEVNLSKLFLFDKQADKNLVFNYHNNDVCAGNWWFDENDETIVWSYAAFTRDYYKGRLYISDSYFVPGHGLEFPYYLNQYPSIQLESWGEGEIPNPAPYPW